MGSEVTAASLPTRAQAIVQLTAKGEAYELAEIEQYGQTVRAFLNAPATLRELFETTQSEATFLVFEDERLTFAQTYAEAAKIGHLLVHNYGISCGDRVAISMRNYPEWVLAFMAITSVGGIAVCMNALWTSEEMEYGLTDSGAKVLFADSERLVRLAGCSDALSVACIAVRPSQPTAHAVLSDLLGDVGEVAMPLVDFGPQDDATILYTSGSTGHPKGAVSCHRNIISALWSWELEGQIAALRSGALPLIEAGKEPPAVQPATLLAVPLFHATGSHAVYLMSYRAQRRMVCMYKWDPALAAGLIEDEKISTFVAPAAMTGDLVAEATRTNRNLSTLQTVGGGGAPRAPEQVKRIGESFGNAMPNTGWGMTETNAIGTGISGVDYLERPASSGCASAVADLRIVDDAGALVAAGERGELQMRGVSVIRGYWNRPDANAETFVDGWLRTGDVAYLDAEGFLFIVDRIKDLVIRGGENIGCGEVEAALLEHPSVQEASVYSVPDERLGEEVGATLYAGADLDEPALREFLSTRIARFMIPRYLRFSTEPLPRIASGKIFKRQLREVAVSELGLTL